MIKRVMQDVYRRKNELLDQLSAYVGIPSVGGNPDGMREAVQYLIHVLESAGLEPKTVDPGDGAYPIIVAEKAGRSAKTVIFYNHYDVADYTNPLRLEGARVPTRVTADRVFGRGVADDKGCTFSRIHAVAAWLRAVGELPVGIRFVIIGKRSAGDPALHRFIAETSELTKGHLVLWEAGMKTIDERPTLSLGAKGYLYLDVVARGIGENIPSRLTVFPNPAWRLVQGLATLKDGEKVRIPGFYDDVLPTTDLDRQYLAEADNAELDHFKKLGVRFLDGKSGVDLMEQLYVTPTLTICGLEAGDTGPGERLVLPGEAKAKLEFRLVPNQDPDHVLDSLRAHLRRQGFEDLEIQVVGQGKPFRTPPAEPMVQIVAQAARDVYGKDPVVAISSIGMSAKWAFAPLPNVGTGVEYWGSREETDEENIRIDDYFQGIEMICTVLQQVGAADQSSTASGVDE